MVRCWLVGVDAYIDLVLWCWLVGVVVVEEIFNIYDEGVCVVKLDGVEEASRRVGFNYKVCDVGCRAMIDCSRVEPA